MSNKATIMIGDPLIEVYKVDTPDGPCFCPKWLRNYRAPSNIWRPNQLTPQGNRIVKVDTIGFEETKEYRLITPIIHAVPAENLPTNQVLPDDLVIHAIYLVCTPEGIQSASSKITMNLYNKMPEMEIVGV